MSKKQKLLARLLSMPKDFTFNEARTLLCLCGWVMLKVGRTAGSRVCFKNKSGTESIKLHKPHPQKELKTYQVREIINALEREGEL